MVNNLSKIHGLCHDSQCIQEKNVSDEIFPHNNNKTKMLSPSTLSLPQTCSITFSVTIVLPSWSRSENEQGNNDSP